ncbi:MAG TPA: tetratricopeptide repeat protein [Patescibacteria group bacterium]|nr:tetratricopeptide repeat protein [Patescibacteria group bacterium]
MTIGSRPRGPVRAPILLACLLAVAGMGGCASGEAKRSPQDESGRLLRLGYVQFERGQTQQALDSVQQSLAKDKNNADAHNFLGLIYMSQSEYGKAAEQLREAVRLNPYFTDAHNQLGICYRETKDYDKAMKEFQIALNDKNFKTPEKVLLNLGNLYVEQGVMSEAVRSFERAVELNPNYIPGYLALGSTYQKMGKPEQAAAQLRKVMTLAPDTPEAARAKQLLESGGARSGS